jgi:hypothetical protein
MGWLISLVAIMTAAQTAATQPAGRKYPFAVGEKFEYDAKLGMLSLGEASIHVVSIDTVRGEPSFLFRFRLDGGKFGLFRIQTILESWTTVGDFKSLRFRNDNRENDQSRLREYDIFPDSGFFRQRGLATTEPTPSQPLDDAAILYYMRQTPLEVGQTYRVEKYFKQNKNPLVIRVLKREKMKLPGGAEVECLVLNPVIGDRGMFADRADARLWVTDDERRIPVQIRSSYPFGTVTLRLEKMTLSE